jgi:type IV pilus assembly protein PilW
MTTDNVIKKNQSGLSLIELMIALSIGLFLVTGIIQLFISSKQTYRLQDNLSQLQENGRFAVDTLSKEIRMAGNYKNNNINKYCNTDTKKCNDLEENPLTNFLYDLEIIAQGFEATANSRWIPAIDSHIIDPKPDSDIIVIRKIDQNNGFKLDGFEKNTYIKLVNSTASALEAAKIKKCLPALIKSPDGILLFQVGGISSGKIISHAADVGCVPDNKTDIFFKGEGTGFDTATLYPFQTFVYYIKNNTNSLYYKAISNSESNAEELVEGIENIQIVYGIDSNDDKTVNHYLRADEVENLSPNKTENWSKVISVRISLLVLSIDDGLSSQTYNKLPYPFQDIPPPDNKTTERRIRKVFTTTIALRSRT